MLVNTLQELRETELASVVLNLIRTAWFNENLRKTAAMRWMSREKIAFDETAVAQHYGLPTGYIDLSQSLDVSTFFACCRYDSGTRTWQPVGSGEGVIYVVDVRNPNCGNVKPVCLQAFPRPSEQWAWVHETTMGQDFDMLPHVRKFVFRHDLAASQRVLKRFRGGADLFPQDSLSDVANTINASRSVPKPIADAVVRDLINDRFGVPGRHAESILAGIEKHLGVEFSETKSVMIMDHAMMEGVDRIWTERLASGKDIGTRLVRSV